MKWISAIPTQSIECIIITDQYAHADGSNPTTVYRLFVYKNNVDIYDDLQFSLAFAQEAALEKFGIPLSAWQQVE